LRAGYIAVRAESRYAYPDCRLRVAARPKLTFRRHSRLSSLHGYVDGMIGVLVALAVVVFGIPPAIASASLPPREIPAAPAVAPQPEVAMIELNFEYSPDWQSVTTSWPELWTVVQWRDVLGNWHDCAGWQGGLDAVVAGQATKTWWVDRSDLGKGPFRWVVQRSHNGAPLMVSEPFYLPSEIGQTVAGSVTLH
jgi:hypothetical protein